jgi:hypothetical protein
MTQFGSGNISRDGTGIAGKAAGTIVVGVPVVLDIADSAVVDNARLQIATTRRKDCIVEIVE